MKTERSWFSLVPLSVTALALVVSTLDAQAQERPRGQQHRMMADEMREECQNLMSERQQMMSRMKEDQEKLSALVTKMQQAEGDAKMDAVGEVVSALVEQRGQMMQHHAEMQPRMMAHMMRHMQMSMSQGGDDPAGACPMMKEMMSMPRSESNSGLD